MVEQTANFDRDQGLSVTESLLAGMTTPPDVIVAANDDMALGRDRGGQGARPRRQGQDHRLRRAARGAGRRSATARSPARSSSSRAARAARPCRSWSSFLQGQEGAGERSRPADADRDHQGQPRQGRAPRRGEVGPHAGHAGLAADGAACREQPRSCAWPGSPRAFPACRRCAASTSRSAAARCMRCSARTAPASRRC